MVAAAVVVVVGLLIAGAVSGSSDRTSQIPTPAPTVLIDGPNGGPTPTLTPGSPSATPTPLDPSNPGAADKDAASRQAERFLVAFNSYGYPDDSPFAFIETARGSMSVYMLEEYADVLEQARQYRQLKESGATPPASEAAVEFEEMLRNRERQKVSVDSARFRTAGVRNGSAVITIACSYRTRIVPADATVPADTTPTKVLVDLVQDETGDWLVLGITYDL